MEEKGRGKIGIKKLERRKGRGAKKRKYELYRQVRTRLVSRIVTAGKTGKATL